MEITIQQLLFIVGFTSVIIVLLISCYKKGELNGYVKGANAGIDAGKETVLNRLIQLHNDECEKLIKKHIPQSDYGKKIQEFIQANSRELYGSDSTVFITNPDDVVVTKRDLADCWIHFDDEGDEE